MCTYQSSISVIGSHPNDLVLLGHSEGYPHGAKLGTACLNDNYSASPKRLGALCQYPCYPSARPHLFGEALYIPKLVHPGLKKLVKQGEPSFLTISQHSKRNLWPENILKNPPWPVSWHKDQSMIMHLRCVIFKMWWLICTGMVHQSSRATCLTIWYQ
jgi:hypothetical protein